MGTKKYTINIEEQVTGGAKCSKPKIEWDKPVCPGIVCELNDGRTIKAAIPDDCTERCFDVTYSCQDPCTDDCDPIRLHVCPCEEDHECDGCSKCEGNLCVSQCDDDEFCTDADTCVECDDEHPCFNGEICVGGECQCPPSKPYKDSNNDCVPCTQTSCPPGQICTPDGCVPITCPEGVWNQEKETCVECNNTGNCGINECCNDDNECECCEDFILDSEGNCIPKPECEVDGDCEDECEYCDSGTCVPVNCGEGKVCIPGEGCVDECDCDNPDCSHGDACVTHSSGVCYCKACTGSCAEGCSDGCICDEDDPDGGCIADPCADSPCENGSECGEGCGCNETTKQCEPCSSAECGEECDNLLGCDCPNGTKCQDENSCSGPCDGYGDCDPGCTCVQGECVSCSDFSCETDDCEDHPECGCNGGNCEGDPDFCEDEFTAEDFDCGVSAELTLADGCMCPGITAYAFPYKIETALSVASESKFKISLALRLAKGFADNWPDVAALHLLDQTEFPDIADNDTPLSGTLNLEIREFYQPQVWQNNSWVNNGPLASRVVTGGGSFSFAGIARKENITFIAHAKESAKSLVVGVSQEIVRRYELYVSTSALTFPNGCVYNPQELDVLKMDGAWYQITNANIGPTPTFPLLDTRYYATGGNYDIGTKLSQWENIGSDSSRKPLITWYRSDDDSYTNSDIIRKIYIGPDSPGRYEDSLFGPATFPLTKENLADPEGRVVGNMYYKVTNDCGCSDRELDLGKLAWCNPASLALGNILYTQCNKKVEVKSDIGRPCATNRHLDEMTLHASDNNTTFKNKHQAKYHLIIKLENGTSVDIPYIWREVGVATAGLYKETDNTSIKSFLQIFTSAITELRLELRYGTSEEVVCKWDGTVPAPADFVPTYTQTCLASGQISYRFNLAPNHITGITAVGGSVSTYPTYKEVTATAGEEVTVSITFSDYCPTTMKLNGNCCDTLGITISRSENGSLTELTAVVTGGVSPHSVEYYRVVDGEDPELVGDSSNPADLFKVILSNPEPGLYYAIVTDENECTKDSAQISVDPIDAADYPITIAPMFNGCAYTGNVAITIPNQPPIVGSQIFYKVDTGAEQNFTVTTGMKTAGQHVLAATGHTVTLIRIEIPNTAGPDSILPLTGSATVPADLTAEVPAITTFTVDGSGSSVSTCAGEDVLLELTGTPFAVAEIYGIAPVTLDGSGYGSTIQNPIISTQYQITSVKNTSGSCVGTQGVGLTRSVGVSATPTIDIVSDECDGTLTFRTVTFSNITSATDQLGNPLIVIGATVTVEPASGVTAIHATYDNLICVATYVHPIASCDCPTITATLTPSDEAVCEGTSFTLTVSGVTGGSAPYSYNYYTDSDYNETYILGQSSKIFGPVVTEVYHVRIKDSNDCISYLGSVTVQVIADPVPNIIAQSGQPGISEVSDNVFEIVDTMTTAVFKTDQNYTTTAWLVTGTYGGTTTGTGATFTIDVTQITGTITLKVTVENETGCIGIEQVDITVEAAPAILAADEMLFVTGLGRLYKATLSPSAVGIPVLLCGSGQPAESVAMTDDGFLVGALTDQLHYIDPLMGCSAEFIGTMQHQNSLGMLNGHTLISFGQDPSGNVFTTYDLDTDVANNNFYTISDAPNTYSSAGDIVRDGNFLYLLAKKRISGVLQAATFLLRATLDGGDNITAVLELGGVPLPLDNAFGLVKLTGGATVYLIYSSGKVYNVDLGNPAASTFIGTVVVPGADSIQDATNNFV